MLKIIKFFMIILLISCIEIRQAQYKSNIQWNNYTGTAITADMVQGYLNIIQSAAISYGSQISLNTQYIRQKLNQIYRRNYQVVIDAFNKSSNFSWTVYQEEGYIVSWSNVNKLFPSWSYLIWTVPYNFPYVLIDTTSHGSGFDSWDMIVLNNIVSSAEARYSNCTCDTFTVSKKTGQFFEGLWSVICSDMSVDLNYLRASISASNKQWIYIRKLCGYIIYNTAE